MNFFKYLLPLFFFIHNTNAQIFDAQNIDLLGRWRHHTENNTSFTYSGIFGYEHQGRQYALLGSPTQFYVVEITDPTNCQVRDSFPVNSYAVEIQVKDSILYLAEPGKVSNAFHIFNLASLPDSITPLSTSITIPVHTLYVNKNRLALNIGSSAIMGESLAYYDISNPIQPQFLAGLNDNYSDMDEAHDALIINDTLYVSCGSKGLNVFKYEYILNSFLFLGTNRDYNGLYYNHNSALLDNHRYLVTTDEGPAAPITVLDVSDLNNIDVVKQFRSSKNGIGHNVYNPGNINDKILMANYTSGIEIYDLKIPNNPIKTGYFDTHYQTDIFVDRLDDWFANFAGAWGLYYFPSNKRLITADMNNGLFVLDVKDAIESNTANVKEEKHALDLHLKIEATTITLSNLELANEPIEITCINALGQLYLHSKQQLSSQGTLVIERPLLDSFYFLKVQSKTVTRTYLIGF